MTEYQVVAVLWQDHYTGFRTELPEDPDDIPPTLSFGAIVNEGQKTIVIVHDIETIKGNGGDFTFTVILKSTIMERKEFGTIQLNI